MTVRKLWFVAGLLLSATLAEAQGIRRPPIPSVPVDEWAPSIEASDAELANWIEDLASGDFRARERALRRLRLAGKAVIPALAARLAEADELETIVRGTSLLGEFTRSRDGIARLHARDALRQLSRSRNSSLAQRAHAILNPVDLSNIDMRLRVRRRGNVVAVGNAPINAPAIPVNPQAVPARPPAANVARVPPPQPSAALRRLQQAYDEARRLSAQDAVPSAEMAPVLRHLEREMIRQLERDVKTRNDVF